MIMITEPCGKKAVAVAVVRTASTGALRRSQPVVQQEELPEAHSDSARRGEDGPRPEQRAHRARCGQRVRSAQTAEEMQRRSKEKKTESRDRTRTPPHTTKTTQQKRRGQPKQHGR